MFLISEDYLAVQKSEILGIVTETDTSLRQDAEEIAQAEMASYLCARYKEADLFPDISSFDLSSTWAAGDLVAFSADNAEEYNIPEWDAATSYVLGDFVVYNNRIYESLAGANLASEPRRYMSKWKSVSGIYRAIAVAGGEWPVHTDYFEVASVRSLVLVKHMRAMVLKELYRRLPARQIPESIQSMYAEALAFLDQAQSGRFCLVEDTALVSGSLSLKSNDKWESYI